MYGGTAGSGKTYALLLECLRFIEYPKHTFVIFRRTTPQITNPGALWDESETIYTQVAGARPVKGNLEWYFKSGSWGRFSHMQEEKDKTSWDGAQIPLICFDQLEHFTESQFWYLLSRNRSATVPYRPYIRATCNPDPDSFLAKLMEWWIDPDTGYAIPERSGVLRYFFRDAGVINWFDTREQAERHARRPEDVKSFTFILGLLKDNPALTLTNPDYESNLRAMPLADRMRLLGDEDKGGNWKFRASAGLFFKRYWFHILRERPIEGHVVARIRYWDRAATGEDELKKKKKGLDPSWTVGVLMAQISGHHTLRYIIEDVVRFRGSPGEVQEKILATARIDGKSVIVGIEQDPGQAGVVEATQYVRLLDGWDVRLNVVRESKGRRAGALSAQAEHMRVALMAGEWNEKYLAELENFDGTDEGHADQVDASSGAHHILSLDPNITAEPVSLIHPSSFSI